MLYAESVGLCDDNDGSYKLITLFEIRKTFAWYLHGPLQEISRAFCLRAVVRDGLGVTYGRVVGD